MIRFIFAVGLLLAIAPNAWALTFEESRLVCEPPTIIATFDRATGKLRVYAPRCVSRTAGDEEVKTFSVPLTSALTSAERRALLALLGRIESAGAVTRMIPTPASTPTPLLESTPLATVSP